MTPTHSFTSTHTDTHMLFGHLPVTEIVTTTASLVENYKQNHRHSFNARMRISSYAIYLKLGLKVLPGMPVQQPKGIK